MRCRRWFWCSAACLFSSAMISRIVVSPICVASGWCYAAFSVNPDVWWTNQHQQNSPREEERVNAGRRLSQTAQEPFRRRRCEQRRESGSDGNEPSPSLDQDLGDGLDSDQAWEGRCGFQRRGPLRSQRGDTHPTSALVVPHVHHHLDHGCFPCRQCRRQLCLDALCTSAPALATFPAILGHFDDATLEIP